MDIRPYTLSKLHLSAGTLGEAYLLDPEVHLFFFFLFAVDNLIDIGTELFYILR